MIYNREDQFSLDRLINRTNTAEGTSLPPQQRGPFRVPYVTSVKASSPEPTKYVITWLEPEGFGGKIAQYNIFVQNSANINQPLGPYTVQNSPASLQIIAPSNSRLTFFVQTQMTSGFTNPGPSSPSTTLIAI
jgi:hypothetical protein